MCYEIMFLSTWLEVTNMSFPFLKIKKTLLHLALKKIILNSSGISVSTMIL